MIRRPSSRATARRSSAARPGRRETPDGNGRGRALSPLPPPPRNSPFTATWWGEAWIRSVEQGAADQARLSRGRTYARGGYVTAVTVAPGRITASVRGSRPRPYRADILLGVLTDDAWDTFLEAVAARPAHIAAFLDHDMPPSLAEATEAAGARLLPSAQELTWHCSCPDDGDPCKHVAALAFETARFLDQDPFLLLLLRGRSADELSEDLARRNAVQAAHTGDRRTAPPPSVGAAAALAGSARPPLPEPLSPPPLPGDPPVLPDAPTQSASRRAPADPLDPDALAFLVTDAAARAHEFLTGAASSPLPALPPWQDAVRLAATHPRLTGRGTFSRHFASLAEGVGGTAAELARAAAAWRQGGEAGLEVLEEPWDPPAGDFDRARSAMAALGFRTSIDRNRLTVGRTQLRYGRDGLWYRYTAGTSGDHWPDGPASGDPVVALHGPAEPPGTGGTASAWR